MIKDHLNTDEKLFGLICIKNDFPKYFAKCHNLFKYFVLHITVIPWNEIFILYLYTTYFYVKEQIKFL